MSGCALCKGRASVLPCGTRMPASCRGPMNMSVLSVKAIVRELSDLARDSSSNDPKSE